MFRLNLEAYGVSTTLLTTVHLVPSALVAVFGAPGSGSGDGKVSGLYRFTGDGGMVFEVYDYKMTSLYSSRMMDPERFWALTTPVAFSVSGKNRSGLERFTRWLIEQTSPGVEPRL
jgi:hypothetical protein